jgi:thiol:disulfide interchange protein DsbD
MARFTVIFLSLFLPVLLCGISTAKAQLSDAPNSSLSLPKKFREWTDVRLEVVPPKAKRGETVTFRFTMDLKPGVDTYPFFPHDPNQTSRNELSLPKPDESAAGDLVFLANQAVDPPGWKEKAREKIEPNEKDAIDQYYEMPVVSWDFKAVVSPSATPGRKEVSLGKNTFIQACKAQCIRVSGDKIPPATFEVIEGTSDKIIPADLAMAEAILLSSKKTGPQTSAPTHVSLTGPNTTRTQSTDAPAPPNANASRKSPKEINEYSAELAVIQSTILKLDDQKSSPVNTGLLNFILTAAAWGLISLVTPCVFPMIPITVSIFLKHAQGSLRERLKLAGIYCLTIISVLGVSAFALLKFMAWLSTNPVTNILLGALFLVLALSLFGMYELTLPNFLSSRLQARQAKGGVIGTIFGALAFTIISFTCVAPFLGGFAGISSADANGESLISIPSTREIVGGLAFATAFAAPFFVLALIPGLLKALPRSGGWLDSVKVVMGFLELAAALKFFRTAEVRLLSTSEYFTYDLVLAGWIAISLACGLYLLNIYRLPHDEEKPSIGVMRLLFALLFLGLGLYLFPATFKGNDGKAQRPSGVVYAWVESFLLPELESKSTDLKEALERARKSHLPVFVDFTGKTCTNCKYNESTVFSRPEFQALFQKFEIVQLYTDEVPAEAYAADPGTGARVDEAERNKNFQQAVFGDIALPLYAVFVPQPDGKVKLLGIREGKINEPAAFAAWLKESLEKAKQ